MYQALGEEGRMLVYGVLIGGLMQVGADPRFWPATVSWRSSGWAAGDLW